MNKFGVNFAVSDVEGNLLVLSECEKSPSNPKLLARYARETLSSRRENYHLRKRSENVQTFYGPNHVLATVLESYVSEYRTPEALGVAMIDLPDTSSVLDHSDPDVSHFEEMLSLLADNFMNRTKGLEQIEMVSTELARVYEELVLLHRISTNMRLTEADSNFLQMACDSLTEIVFVEGIAILLEKTVDNEQQFVIGIEPDKKNYSNYK